MNYIISEMQSIPERLAEGQMPIVVYLGINIGIFLIISIFYAVIHLIRKKSMEKLYMNAWIESFDGNIRTTLTAVKERCRKKPIIQKAVNKGLFYLDHSITRDYEGAIKYIDQMLESKKIRDMHKEYLKKVKVTYLLPSNKQEEHHATT